MFIFIVVLYPDTSDWLALRDFLCVMKNSCVGVRLQPCSSLVVTTADSQCSARSKVASIQQGA